MRLTSPPVSQAAFLGVAQHSKAKAGLVRGGRAVKALDTPAREAVIIAGIGLQAGKLHFVVRPGARLFNDQTELLGWTITPPAPGWHPPCPTPPRSRRGDGLQVRAAAGYASTCGEQKAKEDYVNQGCDARR